MVVTLSQSLSEPEHNQQQQNAKAWSAILKSLLSIQYFILSQPWVYDLGTASSSDPTSALHALCEGKLSNVHWRQGQSWLLGENVEWEAIDGGMLKVMGIICRTLSTNSLIHIPNHGDLQLSTVHVYFSLPFIQHLAFTDPFCII